MQSVKQDIGFARVKLESPHEIVSSYHHVNLVNLYINACSIPFQLKVYSEEL